MVYDYSLSESWLALSADKQREKQTNMNKDLIYRTCSLETVRLAQAKGWKKSITITASTQTKSPLR